MVESPFRRRGVGSRSPMPHPGSDLFGERPDIEVRLDWDFCNGRPTHRQAQRLELAYERKFR
jgi:hypothetical protein